MYFSNFPQALYQVNDPRVGEPARFVALTDITKNVRFKKDILDKITLYDWYLIKEGDSMESTSEKLYGSPYYHWMLMLLNDMYDYRNDFPLEARQFDKYIIEKYGSIQIAKSTISFYRDDRGYVVDSDNVNPITGLSNVEAIYAYDHELAINDDKRRIKIISADMLAVVLDNFRRIL